MRKNLSPETERQFSADVNLRKALRQHYADEPQLPDDFAEKLQSRILTDTQKKKQASIRLHRWRNVAAIVIGILIIGGLMHAAVRLVFPRQVASAYTDNTAANTTREAITADDSLIHFHDARLDSLMAVVGAHYQKAVVFVNEAPQALRFSIAWNTEKPLADFLAIVNEFDGLTLTDERDTIFVTATAEEDEP